VDEAITCWVGQGGSPVYPPSVDIGVRTHVPWNQRSTASRRGIREESQQFVRV
jgi:hypothetical protein